MALVASLREWLAALRQRVDIQERSPSQNDGDEAEDKDGCLEVRCHLHSYWLFITDLLLEYIPQSDPSGHSKCSIALTSLDRSIEEECHLCTIESAFVGCSDLPGLAFIGLS